MAKSESGAMRAWALKGAEQRLVEIIAERTAIFREFPELRRSRGSQGAAKSASDVQGSSTTRTPRVKRSMTAAQRKAVSERMRRYWAERRATSQEDTNQAQSDTDEATSGEAATLEERSAAKGRASGRKRSTPPVRQKRARRKPGKPKRAQA